MESHCNSCIAFENAVCKYFINKDVYFHFRFSVLPCLQTMLPRAIPKISGPCQGPLSQWQCRLVVRTFS